jgi:EmrB/QacA subfamily drug resistance transporter
VTSPETRPAETADQYSYLSHQQILVVLGGLMAGMFLAALDQSIVGTALPRIVSDLGGLEHLSWVVTAYLLTSTASTPLWGKVSDLYGRRPMFQTAIVVFLIGSLVAGAAGSMGVLIGGRAVQGLGAGGLIALALATIGDVIPPRERGRYQGYFGVVFGVSSVAGPLLGGWLTDGPGWQWIFWINIPIGLAALVVTSVALKMPTVRRQHSIDYLGATILVASVTSILLYTAWAGTQYGWTDPLSLTLLIGGIVLAAMFVFVETRNDEPIVPLRLFRNRVYTPTIIFTAIMGLAMFGGIIFLPVYLQVVQGFSPTESGLALLPMVAGLFTTSISSGQLVTRTGRYKIYPILGAAVTGIALLLLSTLAVDTPYWVLAVYFFVFGAGLGLTLQIVVTAVQNAVERRDMGAATSSVTFFRSMGAAFGTAIFGAVLTNRLAHYLAASSGGSLPTGTDVSEMANNVQAIQRLPAELHAIVVDAWVKALHDVFLTAVPILAVAFVVAFFIPELPLRGAADGGSNDSEPVLATD